MSLRVSSGGLYLYARDFWANEDVNSLLTQTKDKIIQNYFQRMMPQLFSARAEASFGNQVDINDIDDFFRGGNDTNSGFIASVQSEVDKYYSITLKEAEALFSSKINSALNSSKSDIEKVNSLNNGQIQELIAMMDAQDRVLDAMSSLASLYKQYVINRCLDAGYKAPRELQESGLFSLGNFKNEGIIKIINEYNLIKNNLNILKEDSKQGLHSFTFFRKTAHDFHALYAEFLFTACSYNVMRNKQKLFKGSVLDANWTGNSKYTIGSGDLSVNIIKHLDKEMQNIINNAAPDFTNRKITATSDTSIIASINGITGTYGGTVKEYSDKSLNKLGDFTTIASSAGSIYYAAQRAIQYGLPSHMASEIWIKNLAGAIVNPSERGIAKNYWSTYKQLIGKLLILDALMGAMGNLTVSSNANNLVFFDNGKTYYIGDLIKVISEADVHGFTGNMFSQWNPYAQDSVVINASKAHWENFISGGSAEAGEAAIDNVLKGIQIKISLNIKSLLSKL